MVGMLKKSSFLQIVSEPVNIANVSVLYSYFVFLILFCLGLANSVEDFFCVWNILDRQWFLRQEKIFELILRWKMPL